MQANRLREVLRFGEFEFVPRSWELRRRGRQVKLQTQPLQILLLLLERPGELVSRERLRDALWPATVFVDFADGLNTAVRKLRQALNDTAEKPRFVETLPRRGYRFIAPVEEVTQDARPSLAVLPLENTSGDPAEEYFADGMTDELTIRLAKIAALRVVSRTSAMRYKSARRSLAKIARELDVSFVVEGAVLRSGDRVRITARLIDAATDRHLWAEAYERDRHDVLAMQSDVAQAIAHEIKVTLSPQEQARLTRERPMDTEAYEAYLKGMYCWNRRTQDTLKKGIEHFQRAIDRKPDYAEAFAGMADCHLLLGFYGAVPPGESMPKAKAAAAKALEIDERLPDALATLAASRALWDWDWEKAESGFRQAIGLDPNYATAPHRYAVFLSILGRFQEAAEEIRIARANDPLSLIINTHVGWILFLWRRYDEAIEQCRATLDIDASYTPARQFLGMAYEQKGMYEDGIGELEKAVAGLGAGPETVAALGHALGVSGNGAEARRRLAQLEDAAERCYVSPYDLAILHAGLRETGAALASLEKAYQERSGRLVFLQVEPRLDPLRAEPHFQDLVRRVGLQR